MEPGQSRRVSDADCLQHKFRQPEIRKSIEGGALYSTTCSLIPSGLLFRNWIQVTIVKIDTKQQGVVTMVAGFKFPNSNPAKAPISADLRSV